MNMQRILVTVLMLSAPLLVGAEVYKFVDEHGNVHYTDKPLKGAEKADLPELQSYSGSAHSGASAPTDTAVPAGLAMPPPGPVEKRSPPVDVRLYSDLAIASPKPDEIFHTANPTVTASVATRSGLLHELGHRVVFYVDGRTQPAAAGQTTLAIQGLTPGAHTLSAAVVDSQGQVLAQSSNINFHLSPPSILNPGARRPGPR